MTSDVSGSEDNRFHQLQTDAKNLASNGKIAQSIKLFQEAFAINPTKKVKKRIEKLQAFLEEYGEEIEESMIKVDDKFYLYHELYKKLYPYQREGVKWLWNLFQKKKGGVLGDDMGLGKTIQIIAFLSGMFDMDAIKFVLIIMPVSLLPNWEKEFQKWTPGISVHCFHGTSKRERERMLTRTKNRGGVLLTSYGMIVNNVDLLTSRDDREFVWDYVILDEAHKIKNPTKTTKAAHSIPARNRIALTGTPIQNNLRELWSLYDFVQQGTLLGSLQTFKMQYEIPITRSREKDATVGEQKLGTEIAENLLNLIQPYFLQRTKLEVLNRKEGVDTDSPCHNEMNLKKEFFISRKNDFIIWLYLTEKQVSIYKDFLELDRVKNILMTKRSPLVELTVLKKICDHPRLLSKRACLQLGLDGEVPYDIDELDEDIASAVSIENVTDEDLIKESGKLMFLLSLLSNLKEANHRILLFSQSRKMLDIINRILVNRKWKVMRIDGTINKIEERQKRIQHFQEDLSIPIFLLTTQVGGVGFTLTGADRVIIYDPSWNPATDAQAVDRAYRIGQDKNVVIYRLITCSTVEEKIYRRQIFKDSITRQATGGNKNPHRYFTKQELRELFTLENPYHSATQQQLEAMHADERRSDVSLDGHIAFLYSLNIFGISDHDLMFSGEQMDSAENENDEMRDEYIRKRVETAQQLLSIECAQTSKDNAKSHVYARPYTVPANIVRSNPTKNMYKPAFPDAIDLNDINESLQHMSFQENSINICDSSATPYRKAIDIGDSQFDLPVELKNVENGLDEALTNGDEIIIPDDENQESHTSFVDINAVKTSVQRRSRKSLLYVPESDEEVSMESNSDGDLFVPDSDDSHGNEKDSLTCDQNTAYRNKEIDCDISQLNKYQNNQEIENTDNCMSLSLQQKQGSELINTVIENDDAHFPETDIIKNSAEAANFADMCYNRKEVPITSLSTDCVDIDFVSAECNKNNILQSGHFALSTNQINSEADSNAKVMTHSCRKENQHPFPVFSTPLKNEFLLVSSEKITPLNSSFQKALFQSPEIMCTSSSPHHTTKEEKFIHSLTRNNNVSLNSIGTTNCLAFKNAKSETSHQKLSIPDISFSKSEYNNSTVSLDSSDELVQTCGKKSPTKNLMHSSEQISECNESNYSPVNCVRNRKAYQRIMDSDDESEEWETD